MDIAGLVHIVIVLLVVGMIAGLLWYLVGRAPFLADPHESDNPMGYSRALRGLCDLFSSAPIGIWNGNFEAS
jgi:dipeptide/tripeptide permease